MQWVIVIKALRCPNGPGKTEKILEEWGMSGECRPEDPEQGVLDLPRSSVDRMWKNMASHLYDEVSVLEVVLRMRHGEGR